MVSALGRRVMQVFFIIANVLFLLFGILLISAGGFALSGFVDSLLPISNFGTVAGIIIAVGLFVLGVAVLGVVGGARRNNMLLRIYFGVLLLIVIVQMSVAIGALALRPQLQELLDLGWEMEFNETVAGQPLLRSIQDLLNCCGFGNPADRPVLPCPTPTPSVGCSESLLALASTQANYIGVAGLLFGFVEIAALVVSCFLHEQAPSSAARI